MTYGGHETMIYKKHIGAERERERERGAMIYESMTYGGQIMPVSN